MLWECSYSVTLHLPLGKKCIKNISLFKDKQTMKIAIQSVALTFSVKELLGGHIPPKEWGLL